MPSQVQGVHGNTGGSSLKQAPCRQMICQRRPSSGDTPWTVPPVHQTQRGSASAHPRMDARRDHDQAQKVDATLRQEMQASARPCLTQRWHGFSSSHFTLDLRQTAHASEMPIFFVFAPPFQKNASDRTFFFVFARPFSSCLPAFTRKCHRTFFFVFARPFSSFARL